MRNRTAGLLLGLMVCGLAAWAQSGGLKLMVNGSPASSSARLINGRLYAPVDEIAKALNMVVVKRGGGYDLTAPGGANQVEGLNGKVGDMLFDGKWRFQLKDIQVVKTYALRRDGGVDPGKLGGKASIDGRTYTAEAGYTFVIANCLVKNGQKESRAFGSFYGEHTALTDDQGSSYRPIGWDQEGGLFTTKELLPGAGQEIAAIFLVPENVKLKDLVVTLTNVTDREPKDVRISLGG
jgi:hypothetical protein